MSKRLLVLVFLLGVAGALLYAIRARQSSSDVAPADGWHVHEEDDESAPQMRVREAGSATA